MFTSDHVYHYRFGFGQSAGWYDSIIHKLVPEAVVYTHIVQRGVHIRAIVDDDEPEGVEWVTLPGIAGLLHD